jgi:hypothetical protein
MKSVRLGNELEARLRQAARLAGQCESQMVREAVAAQCERIFSRRREPFVGRASLPGPAGKPAGSPFVELLGARAPRRAR